MKDALHLSVYKRDERIVEKQKKITAALRASGSAINYILSHETIDPKMVAFLSDIGSILADLQHDENNIRKSLIMSGLNPTFKETLKGATPDQFLFGKDLEERVKLRELIERSSKKLRPPSKTSYASNPKNAKNPSRSRKSTAVQSDGNKPPASQPPNHSKKDQESYQRSSQNKERSGRQRSRYPSRRER